MRERDTQRNKGRDMERREQGHREVEQRHGSMGPVGWLTCWVAGWLVGYLAWWLTGWFWFWGVFFFYGLRKSRTPWTVEGFP